jgi:hypothetical protein
MDVRKFALSSRNSRTSLHRAQKMVLSALNMFVSPLGAVLHRKSDAPGLMYGSVIRRILELNTGSTKANPAGPIRGRGGKGLASVSEMAS